MKAEEIIKVIQDNSLQKVLFKIDDPYECTDVLQEDHDMEFDGSDLTKDQYKSKVDEYFSTLGLKNFEIVQDVCNTDEMYVIIHFKDEDIYLELTGTYDSYGEYDHDYHDKVKQVFPKQVTVTKYIETNEL